MTSTILSLLLLLMLGVAGDSNDSTDVDLRGVRALRVIRTGSDTLDVVMDVRDRLEPPSCTRLWRGAVRASADGARVDKLVAGGAGWTTQVSSGLPIPMPRRACMPAVLRLKDVRSAVHIEIADAHQSWSIELAVPPMPACRWLDPKDGRIVHGQRVRAACDTNDVAAIEPGLFFMLGPNPSGTRPALQFAGNEIAFVVPDDWKLREKHARVRVHFPKTKPTVVTSTAPLPVDTADKLLLQNYSDLRVR